MFKSEQARKLARGKIKKALLKQLKETSSYHEPYIDLVDRYMSLWDAQIELETDIKERGVSVLTSSGIKKNDSVTLSNGTLKQMLATLKELGLQPIIPKAGGGEDL